MVSRRAIVGLGNPGARYEGTRHNVGFAVVDALAKHFGAVLSPSADGARWALVEPVDLGQVLLVEPQRYMNRSGEPLTRLMRRWDLAPSAVLVVHDDVDLELGRLKLKSGGGAGGHRGLLSIEDATGTREFARLRFGIGRPGPESDTADYVLARFSEAELPVVAAAMERACAGALDWLRLDFQAATKRVNTKPEKPVESTESGC